MISFCKHFIVLFVVIVLATFTISSLAAAETAAGPVVRSLDRENSFVVPPGSTRELRAVAQQSDGTGVPGLVMIFAAPTEGPSGTFPAATSGTKTLIKVTTDSNGVARANIVTNDIEGVFAVGVAAEGFDAFSSFAFTNTADPPVTPMTPMEVRLAMETQYLEGAALNKYLQLHGPFYVPAGTILSGPGRPVFSRKDRPVVAKKDSWLLWVDEMPLMLFAHDAQWILIDAQESPATAIANAEVHRTLWWPVVHFPGSDADWSLHMPARSHPGALEEELLPPLVPESAGIRLNRRAASFTKACAIVIQGPGMRGGAADIFNYRKYLLLSGQVPAERIFTNGGGAAGLPGTTPITVKDLKNLIAKVGAEKCDKVFIMFATHGADSSQGGGLLFSDPSGGGVSAPGLPPNLANRGLQLVSYEDYVLMLTKLGKVQLCLYQGSCYSGQLVEWIEGYGFTGSVVTATNAENPGWESQSGGALLGPFLRAKLTPAADTDGKDGVSDKEALDWATLNIPGPILTLPTGEQVNTMLGPNPLADTIPPDAVRRILTPDIYIPAPEAQRKVIIRKPKAAKGHAFQGKIFLGGVGDIAVFKRFSSTPKDAPADETEIKMSTRDNTTRVDVVGTKCGFDVYEIVIKDQNTGQIYSGVGRLQVGDFSPDPVPVIVSENADKDVKLTFFGRTFGNLVPAGTNIVVKQRQATLLIKTANKETAVPKPEAPGKLTKRGNVTEVSFKVLGKKAGMTKFKIELEQTAATKPLKVIVVKDVAGETKVGLNPCDEGTMKYAARVEKIRDLYMHDTRVGQWRMVNLNVRFMGGGDVEITGDIPQFNPAHGTVNCDTLQFTAMGNSGSTPIADFMNVPSTLTGQFGVADTGTAGLERRRVQSDGTLTMTYVLGSGMFPGGPIEYDLSAVAEADGGGAGCSYEITANQGALSFQGGGGSVLVNTSDNCAWMPSSSASWLTVADASGGVGPGVAAFTVEQNDGPDSREATITAGGKSVTVTQIGAATQRPVIAAAGVVNGASFDRGITPACWITIQGWNLAPGTRVWVDGDFNGVNLPTTLDGVSVTIGGVPAYIFFISPNQLNVLVPDGVSSTGADVVVTTAAGSSAPFAATLYPVDPALFMFDPEARRYAAAVHADGIFVAKRGLFGAGLNVRPASPGDVVLLFGTGFGPTDPPVPTGQLVSAPARLVVPVVVRIGGRIATVQFAGLVSSGLYQFNVVIPQGLEPGDYLVEIFIDGIPIQDGVYITVE